MKTRVEITCKGPDLSLVNHLINALTHVSALNRDLYRGENDNLAAAVEAMTAARDLLTAKARIREDEVEALRKSAERYARLWELQDDGDLYLCKCVISDEFGNVNEVQFDDRAEMDAYLDAALAARPGEKG